MRHKVLVVEDDFGVRESLADVLSDAGYEVACAADGIEALALLRADPQPPQLILLDWMMPRCDGAQVMAALQADGALADIPVVLLTADVRLQSRAAAFGVRGFLKKPVELAHLLREVGRHARPPDPATRAV